MRLLNVGVIAAVVVLGLIGVTTLGSAAAGAQEDQSAEQTRNGQESAECPGAQVVETIGPTEQDLRIGPFSITGERFRLTYETTDLDPAGVPFFDVTVLNASGNEVGGQVIFDEGTEIETVNQGPGNFTIEARVEDLKYKLTIEDCTGKGGASPNEPPADRTPIPADQYKSDTDNPDDVIDDTVTDKPLPDTGGIPLIGLVAFGSFLLSAGFMILRPVIRRPH